MQLSDLDSAILYEDSDIIVLNKPAGWVVNRSHTYSEPTVQDWMIQRLKLKVENGKLKIEKTKVSSLDAPEYGTPEEIFQQRSGIVHRLDKDTSGVLLL